MDLQRADSEAPPPPPASAVASSQEAPPPLEHAASSSLPPPAPPAAVASSQEAPPPLEHAASSSLPPPAPFAAIASSQEPPPPLAHAASSSLPPPAPTAAILSSQEPPPPEPTITPTISPTPPEEDDAFYNPPPASIWAPAMFPTDSDLPSPVVRAADPMPPPARASAATTSSTSHGTPPPPAPALGEEHQRVAVLLLLGTLQQWPHEQEAALRQRLERKVASRLDLCGMKGKEAVVQRSVYWPAALQRGGAAAPSQLWTDVSERVDGAKEGSLRRPLVDFASFCAAYHDDDGGGASEVHRVIDLALSELAAAAGPTAPLVVVAHHLGCVLAVQHLTLLQYGEAEATTALERGETLASLWTLGCPDPMWRAVAAQRDPAEAPPLSLRIPAPQLSPLHGGFFVGALADLGWTNFYHPADALAYPMHGHVSSGVAVADVHVKLGGNECAPTDYLDKKGSREILSPIAHAVVELFLQVRPAIPPFHPAALRLTRRPPLQVNPQIEADTAQLDALKEHKSGTRAVIAKQTLAAREKGFAAATGAMSALSGAVQRAKEAAEQQQERRQERRGTLQTASIGSADAALAADAERAAAGGGGGGGARGKAVDAMGAMGARAKKLANVTLDPAKAAARRAAAAANARAAGNMVLKLGNRKRGGGAPSTVPEE